METKNNESFDDLLPVFMLLSVFYLLFIVGLWQSSVLSTADDDRDTDLQCDCEEFMAN